MPPRYARTDLPIHTRVESFLRLTGLTATRFGVRAAGDPNLVRDLRNGRDPRPAMISRLEHFMNKHQETSQ